MFELNSNVRRKLDHFESHSLIGMLSEKNVQEKTIKINIVEQLILRPENERILILRVQCFIVSTWVNSQLARNHTSALTLSSVTDKTKPHYTGFSFVCNAGHSHS